MGGIEPGTSITTATLTYLARAKIGWMLDPFITNVDFTDNIRQGQNHYHSEYFFDNIRGSNIHPILTLLHKMLVLVNLKHVIIISRLVAKHFV